MSKIADFRARNMPRLPGERLPDATLFHLRGGTKGAGVQAGPDLRDMRSQAASLALTSRTPAMLPSSRLFAGTGRRINSSVIPAGFKRGSHEIPAHVRGNDITIAAFSDRVVAGATAMIQPAILQDLWDPSLTTIGLTAAATVLIAGGGLLIWRILKVRSQKTSTPPPVDEPTESMDLPEGVDIPLTVLYGTTLAEPEDISDLTGRSGAPAGARPGQEGPDRDSDNLPAIPHGDPKGPIARSDVIKKRLAVQNGGAEHVESDRVIPDYDGVNIPPEHRGFIDKVYAKAKDSEKAAASTPEQDKVWETATDEIIKHFEGLARTWGNYAKMAEVLNELSETNVYIPLRSTRLKEAAAELYKEGGQFEKSKDLWLELARAYAQSQDRVDPAASAFVNAALAISNEVAFKTAQDLADFLVKNLKEANVSPVIQIKIAFAIGRNLGTTLGPYFEGSFLNEFSGTFRGHSRNDLISRILLDRQLLAASKQGDLTRPGFAKRLFSGIIKFCVKFTIWSEGQRLKNDFGLDPAKLTLDSLKND